MKSDLYYVWASGKDYLFSSENSAKVFADLVCESDYRKCMPVDSPVPDHPEGMRLYKVEINILTGGVYNCTQVSYLKYVPGYIFTTPNSEVMSVIVWSDCLENSAFDGFAVWVDLRLGSMKLDDRYTLDKRMHNCIENRMRNLRV